MSEPGRMGESVRRPGIEQWWPLEPETSRESIRARSERTVVDLQRCGAGRLAEVRTELIVRLHAEARCAGCTLRALDRSVRDRVEREEPRPAHVCTVGVDLVRLSGEGSDDIRVDQRRVDDLLRFE